LAKTKFYVVWVGKKPGIYPSWAECSEQVKGYSGAKYKAFNRESLARQAFEAGWQAYGGKSSQLPGLPPEVIADSVSVDAACDGSPGNLEYRGVNTATGEELFHRGPLSNGTNNLGEFLAIVHALRLLTGQGKTNPIYSDSRNALLWVEKKYVGSKLPRNDRTEVVWTLADEALDWLKANRYPNKSLKWKTEEWGEIRADFGRK
jgi:ribonuclease HI